MPSAFEPDSPRMRKKLDQLSEFARSKGGKFLSSGYKGTKGKLSWECEEGHTWEASADGVLRQGSWCPTCAGNLPKSLEELRAVAEARGGKLLSLSYINVGATYDFECSRGHQFSNQYKHVVGRGQWCPTCNKGSKSEELARVAFEHVFGVPFPKKRPEWLRNERGNQMELDGFAEDIGIAFEYQGIQHFTKSLFGKSVDQRIKDDEKKLQLCKNHQVRLFYLTHEMVYQDFAEEIERQCLEFEIDTSKLNFSKKIDFDKAYIRDDRLEKLKSILEQKRIEVISTKWIGIKDKYKFRCLNCGHEWEAQGTAFFNSRRISGCDSCARTDKAKSQLLGLEALHEFAKSQGGECLSKEYVQRRHTYEWRCKDGHTFVGNFNNMKFRNKFCPECAKAKK